MSNGVEKANKSEAAVEKALSEMIQGSKSFVPPEHKGIHELIEEIEELADLVLARVKIVKKRLAEFDNLQHRFYSGDGT